MKMPRRWCQKHMTSTDFVVYKMRLEQRVNEFHREDYFHAQIAYMLMLVNSKDPKQVKFDDFLLKFKQASGDGEPKPVDQEERVKRSMSIWGSLLGVKVDTDD